MRKDEKFKDGTRVVMTLDIDGSSKAFIGRTVFEATDSTPFPSYEYVEFKDSGDNSLARIVMKVPRKELTQVFTLDELATLKSP